MSQGEVLELLEENGSMTETEISDKLGITLSSVWTNLHKMLKNHEVERKLTTSNCKEYIYFIKE